MFFINDMIGNCVLLCCFVKILKLMVWVFKCGGVFVFKWLICKFRLCKCCVKVVVVGLFVWLFL